MQSAHHGVQVNIGEACARTMQHVDDAGPRVSRWQYRAPIESRRAPLSKDGAGYALMLVTPAPQR